MDSAIKTNRKFPAYTTAQLEDTLAGRNRHPYAPELSAETRAMMEQEVADRKSGVSKTLHQRLQEAAARIAAERAA